MGEPQTIRASRLRVVARPHDADFLTVKQACDLLQVTAATLYNHARAGRLPLLKVGRLTRVRRKDLLALVQPVLVTRRKAGAR